MPLLALAAALTLNAHASCVTKLPSGGYDEPVTMDGLRACQRMERDALLDSMNGQRLGKAQARALKTLDARQRREEARYSARHPEARLSLTEAPAEAEPQARPAAAKAAPSGDDKAQVDPALREQLLDASDNGRKGMTPEMAAAIRANIVRKQGYVSPDMQDLLDSTSRDGANLRTSTMVKLQNAAKQAKGAGLDLKTDQPTEDLLLKEDLSDVPENPGAATPGASPGL